MRVNEELGMRNEELVRSEEFGVRSLCHCEVGVKPDVAIPLALAVGLVEKGSSS